MEFPHLKDTKFPNFNNVDVYAFRNEFDYTRWGENTRIRLVNVLWDADYNDVVKFDSDEARDEWFDSLDDTYDVTLNTFIRIIPDGTIKLPIPYDVISRYNYCYVDIPIATSEEHPIDYENDWGYKRWYFFITGCNYHAPNTTLVSVAIDVWTQFVNDMQFKYLMLERGHAPVAFSDVDDYLSNPYKHSEYLLAPDVNYDNTGIVRTSNYIPIGNDEKYVCFASFCGIDKFDELGRVVPNSDYGTGTPTYSNTSDRWGYQYQVDNYGIGTGWDYSNAYTPVTVGTSTGNRIPDNTTVYALPSKEVYGSGTFFDDVMELCPQFFNTVLACFIVPRSMLTIGAKKELCGHYIYECLGTESKLFENFTFSKADFKFPSKYARYAKLYTHPYSVVEITDNEGSSREIKIEETSRLTLNLISSVAFPFLDIRVFFDGIAGEGSQSYKWVDLAGNVTDEKISNSRWYEWCIDWAIPTFTIYMDGATSYQLSNFNRQIKNPRESALVSYENAVRSANTSYENSLADSNTANTNAHASNDTVLGNANRIADTNKINIDAIANGGIENQNRSNGANRDNADFTILKNYSLAGHETAHRAEKERNNRTLNNGNASRANAQTIATTNANNERTVQSAGANHASNFGGTVGSIAGLAATGAGLGTALLPGLGTAAGAAAGALTGAAAAGIGAAIGGLLALIGGTATASSIETTSVAVQNANQAICDATTNANSANASAGAAVSQNILVEDNQWTWENVDANTDLLDYETDVNNAAALGNATNNANISMANGQRAKDTDKANALANNTTGNANADRTKLNSQANSGYTREAAILNAKNSLEQQRNTALNALADARNASPREIGSTTGNQANNYFKNKGIQIKVKTQSDSAIAMTGDTFARYGYALNQVWDMKTGFNLMKNFTYWKAEDVWIDDINASNAIAQTTVSGILNKGVTVWSNPDNIGKVSIYDN